jgi:hypothetical protein
MREKYFPKILPWFIALCEVCEVVSGAENQPSSDDLFGDRAELPSASGELSNSFESSTSQATETLFADSYPDSSYRLTDRLSILSSNPLNPPQTLQKQIRRIADSRVSYSFFRIL